MLEDRQHNALAALDIFQNVIRADSLSGDVARWQRAFDEAKRANDPRKPPATPTPAKNDANEGQTYYAVPFTGRKRGFTRVEDNTYRVWASSPADAVKRAQAALSSSWNVDSMGAPVEDKNNGRADAAPVACTFILVDGSVDQVISHTGAWQSIVAREVRDLKKMDCGKVTTKEYASETIGYTKHDSVRKDAAPDAASLSARVEAALAAGELSAVTAASLKRAIASGALVVADAGLKSVGF